MAEEKKVPVINEDEGEKDQSKEEKLERGAVIYCNRLENYLHRKWRYYRDQSVAPDNPAGVCGNDWLSVRYNSNDQWSNIGDCPAPEYYPKYKLTLSS